MKIALNQLNKLFASYGLQAIHARPIENGYVAQTNKGKRLVTIWDHFERLRWSNRWREILYRDGEQQTTRFLETRNKKKYIRYQGKYFVVSVFPEGRAIDPASEEECGVAGEIFARFHKALEKIDQKADAKSHFQLNEQYFANGSAVIQQVVGAIEKKTTPTLTDELIYANLPSLSHRFKTARQLWEGVNEPSSRFPLSFSRLDLNAMTLEEDGWTFHGGTSSTLSVMHHDTASLIRDIYKKSGWNLQSVVSFLDGYHSERKWTENELIYILVQFAIPWNVWNHFEHYLTNANLSEDETERMLADIDEQRYWDDLTAFLGRYIDRRKSESA